MTGQNEIDASGCMVLPGLIDCHVHVYEHCTQLGVNADDNCLARGLTLKIHFLIIFVQNASLEWHYNKIEL